MPDHPITAGGSGVDGDVGGAPSVAAATGSVPESALEHAEHARLVGIVTAAAARGPVALRRLWEDLVARHGSQAASRVWQEALSSSDVGQT